MGTQYKKFYLKKSWQIVIRKITLTPQGRAFAQGSLKIFGGLVLWV